MRWVVAHANDEVLVKRMRWPTKRLGLGDNVVATLE